MLMNRSILVFGYGNPAREDDGLGPAVIERLETLDIDGVTCDSNYQLQVEDAAAISEYDVVVFVDAMVNREEPYIFQTLEPERVVEVDSHSVEPAGIVGLAQELFNSRARAYMLGIRGYSFTMFKEGLTEEASENMEKAMKFLVHVLHEKSFDRTHVPHNQK